MSDAPSRFTLETADAPPVEAVWRSESEQPTPKRVSRVDDRLTAAAASGRVRRGEHLLYVGNYKNARQLLTAMGKRASPARSDPRGSPLEAFRSERRQRERENETLSRLLVSLDAGYQLGMKNAPDVGEACRWAWGAAPAQTTVVPLKTLLGVMGAAEWYRKGVEVPGLEGRIHPRYGVFVPTRHEYVQLLSVAPAPQGRVFDIGTGTGVLSFLLLQHGAKSVIATDNDPRAVACARENAERRGLEERFQVVERDLFPEGRANLVVCNPPWLPESPKTRLDRAVFDPDSRFLRGFIDGVAAHLEPGGEAYLILSNLAELLGLRPEGALKQMLESANLTVPWTKTTPPLHPRAHDTADPLHAIRSREITTLYCLKPLLS